MLSRAGLSALLSPPVSICHLCALFSQRPPDSTRSIYGLVRGSLVKYQPLQCQTVCVMAANWGTEDEEEASTVYIPKYYNPSPWHGQFSYNR